MAKGQGVVYIKYVDNNISSGMNGHAVNIFFDVYDFGQYAGFRNIEKIIIVPEENIKKFVIQRTDHEDLVINVNGGTYRDE